MTKWWTVLITIALFAAIDIWNPDPLKSLRYIQYDYFQQQMEPIDVEDIVLVNIDEKAIRKEGQYPWPRDTVAKYLNNGPADSLYVMNMLYSEKDRFNGDQALQQAMANKAVVLSSMPTTQLSDGVGNYVGVGIFGQEPKGWLYEFPGLLFPIDDLSSYAFGVGASAAIPDQPTGVVRRAPLVIRAAGERYPGLALDVLRVYTGEPSYTIKTGDNGVEWVRIGKQDPITTDSFAQLNIAYWNKFKQVSIVDPLPAGKVLIFGVTAEGYSNPVPTPTGGLYPHVIQGHLVNTALSGVQIQEPDWTPIAELLALVLIGLVIFAVVYTTPTLLAGSISLGILCACILVPLHVWNSALLFFDTTLLFLSSLVVFAQSSFNKYYVTYQQKQQIKKQFGTYLSPDMVRMLQDDPSLLKLGGERREMSFMFMDICGFTPISEHYKNNDDPEGLVELVNKFLDLQTKIILNNNGTVDKYMGDCIMAFWNAPLPCDNHADMAVKTSIEIIEATKELNEELKPLGLPPINVGIGVNTGDCIVGNMGSEVRFDYSVIGDAVNLAARLESQTRNYAGVDLLLSSFTRDSCTEGTFTEVDRIKVKGKTEEVTIYTNT